jgi:hypothetical protein
MSLPDDDLPDPAEFRREMARVDTDFATARRLLAALSAEDHAGTNAVLVQIVGSKRGSMVLCAMARQCLDFSRVLDAYGLLRDERNEPISFQQWIDAAAMSQLDVAAQDQRDLDGE